MDTLEINTQMKKTRAISPCKEPQAYENREMAHYCSRCFWRLSKHQAVRR